MDLGVITHWTDDVDVFRRQIGLADELGYDVIGVGDSPARGHEVYVALTVAAHQSRRATLAPLVTTPFLRHPAVTAAAISALDELSGGRALLGLGNGGSATRVLGRPRGANQRQLGDYADAVRAILAGGSAEVDGRTTEVLERVRPVPLYVAADHPRTLRLAGRIADGVIITVGLSAERAERKIALFREGAVEAGRDPARLPVWGFSFVSVRETADAAIDEVATALASNIGLRLTPPHLRDTIPPELLGAVEELERRYDLHDHVPGGKNARLIRELGLVDFAAGMTAVTGTVAQVRAHLATLEGIGVAGLFATLPALERPEDTLHGLAEARGTGRSGGGPAGDRQTSSSTR